ncbi:MAG: PAS domain-containing protein, partial [Synechococcaceae cyanobacterium SM1_2_3]|nr:PAS domain-containing protein [Synechococcaceae cyanobacterium SM1_2_3]
VFTHKCPSTGSGRTDGAKVLEHLITDQAQVIPGYRITAPYHFQRQQIPVKILRPIDYGIDFYGDSLFAHARWVENHPTTVQRFVTATLRGWRYALDHPDEIADQIARTLPRADPLVSGDLRDFNRFQAEAIKELMLYGLIEIGHTNPHRWRRMHDLILKIGIVKKPLDMDAFIFDPEEQKQEQERRNQRHLRIFLYAIAGIVVVTMAWNLALQSALRQRTKSLHEAKLKLDQDNHALRRAEAQRKTAEATLRESEERLQRVLDGSNDGLWEWNMRTGEHQINPRWAEMLGYDFTEIEPYVNSWEQRVHPDDLPHCQVALQAHFAGATPRYESEHRVRAKNGEWRWILDRGKVTAWDAQGQPLRMAGTHTDITKRKLAEEALRASESRYQTLVDLLPQGVEEADLTGRITFTTPRWSICTAGRKVAPWGGSSGISPQMGSHARRNRTTCKESSVNNRRLLLSSDGIGCQMAGFWTSKSTGLIATTHKVSCRGFSPS